MKQHRSPSRLRMPAVVLLAVVTVGWYVWSNLIVSVSGSGSHTAIADVKSATDGQSAGYDETAGADRVVSWQPGFSGELSEELFTEQLALELLEKYAASIHDKRVQTGLLKVRDYVLSVYPEHGLRLFEAVIYKAFPELAAEILAMVAAMAAYEIWLQDSHLALSQMSLLERNGALWQKRRELFGNDASVIWAEEQQVLAKKQQEVRAVIDTLDQSFDTSLDEKLFQLQGSLSEIYDGGLEKLALENSVVAQVFFGFESVQQTLRNLPAEQRQAEINRVRMQLGYPEEQIERLEAQDQKRNARWEKGLAYMAERNQLLASESGARLETELQRLRSEHFGHEAKTIALEEQDGFFRFERPRIHGRN
jgi:hypothetical protein